MELPEFYKEHIFVSRYNCRCGTVKRYFFNDRYCSDLRCDDCYLCLVLKLKHPHSRFLRSSMKCFHPPQKHEE